MSSTGGAGSVDVLNVTISGTAVGNSTDYTATPSISGVEKVRVSNVATDTDSSVALDVSLAGNSLASVGTVSSNNAGVTTKFTNVGNLVDVEMGGRNNLSVAYTSSLVSGAADSINLTVNNVGTTGNVATFTTSGVETVNLTSSTSANNVKLSDSAAKTVNVTGDKALFLDANIGTNTALKTIDASKATAAVSVDVSGGAVTSNVTLGAAGGTVYMGTRLDSADTITGGSGTNDTLAVSQGNTSSATTLKTSAASLTGFERVQVTSTDNTATGAVDVNGLTGVNTVAMGNISSMSFVVAGDTSGGSAGDTITVSLGINGTTVSTTLTKASSNITAQNISDALVSAINSANIGVTAANAGGLTVTISSPANSGVSITTVPAATVVGLTYSGTYTVTTQSGFDNLFTNLAANTALEIFGGKGGYQGGSSTITRDIVSALLADASGTADTQVVNLKAGAGTSYSYTLKTQPSQGDFSMPWSRRNVDACGLERS